MKDIPRTYPTHIYFKYPNSKGKIALYNILKAYLIYEKGY